MEGAITINGDKIVNFTEQKEMVKIPSSMKKFVTKQIPLYGPFLSFGKDLEKFFLKSFPEPEVEERERRAPRLSKVQRESGIRTPTTSSPAQGKPGSCS